MMQRRLGFEIFPKLTIHDVVVLLVVRKWPQKIKSIFEVHCKIYASKIMSP